MPGGLPEPAETTAADAASTLAAGGAATGEAAAADGVAADGVAADGVAADEAGEGLRHAGLPHHAGAGLPHGPDVVLPGGVAGAPGDAPGSDVVPAAADGGPRPAGDDIDPSERTPRSFHLSRRLLERARAAAYWAGQSPAAGEPTNVSELVERALRSEVERLERTYNEGAPFPAVVGKMRTGPGASGVERIRRAQRARRR